MTSNRINAKRIVHRYLPNGMEVYLEHTNLAPLTCLQVWVKTGSVDEQEHEAGLAHFVEHMLFKGTTLHPRSGEVAQSIETAGGEINAFTKFENTVYQATVPSHFTENAISTLLAMVSHATFDSAELERERHVILEEFARLRDHPGSIASLHLFAEIFKGTRLQRPVIGHVDVIKNAPHGLIHNFYKRWYIPNNMIFVAAGDFNPEALYEFLVCTTPQFKPGTIPDRAKNHTLPAMNDTRAVHITHGPWQEARVTFGCQAPALESAETPAWHMFTSLLGSGDSSRLTRVVHDELQLVANIDSGIFLPRSPMGMFNISYFGEATKAAHAARASVEEIVRIARDGANASEMNRIVNNMLADRIFGKESVEGLANNSGFALQTSRKIAFEDDYIKRLQCVSARNIQEIARQICELIQTGKSMFSIAADEHVGPELTEEMFISEAKKPLQKSFSFENWRNSPAYSQHILRTSPHASDVQQVAFTFPNGTELHINCRALKRLPIISASLAFRGGTFLEEPEKNGSAHIAAELLAHGTMRQTYEAFVDEIEDKAASISTFSTHDISGIQMDCLAEHGPRVFEMLTDCVFRPALSPVQWERIRIDSLNALIAQKDNPMVRIRRNLSPILFGNHTYSRHPLGTEETLNALTLDDAHIHVHRMLSANKFVLSIAGDFNLDRFVTKIHAEFSQLSEALDAQARNEWSDLVNVNPPGKPTHEQNRLVFEPLQREQAHIALAFQALPIINEKRLAIELASTVLGGQGGRLFRDLRDSQSLAYSLGTSHIIQAQAGSFFAFMGTAPKNMEAAFLGLKHHLQKMASETVSDAELERAKKSLLGGRNIDAQYFHYQASQLSMSDLYGLDFDNFLRFDERVNAITARDIQESFAQVLSENLMNVCIVGPEGTWLPSSNQLLWE